MISPKEMCMKWSTFEVIVFFCFPTIAITLYSLGLNLIISPIIGSAYLIVGLIDGDPKKIAKSKSWWISAIPVVGVYWALAPDPPNHQR